MTRTWMFLLLLSSSCGLNDDVVYGRSCDDDAVCGASLRCIGGACLTPNGEGEGEGDIGEGEGEGDIGEGEGDVGEGEGDVGEGEGEGEPDCTVLDRDGDGFAQLGCGDNADDCDDNNAEARPGALEQYGNSVDENCDGRADVCGDGFIAVRFGEQCDGGEFCFGCQQLRCGDGIITSAVGETCEDMNDLPGDGCFDCRPEVCGDGVINFAGGENCEPPSTGNCNAVCRFPTCGDGLIEGTENCEGPDTAVCVNCRGVVCLDGVYNFVIENCDPSAPDSPPCNPDCTYPQCGNGILEPGEGCEVGDANCGNCQIALCGDGIVNFAIEECELPQEHCTNCVLDRVCGDGFLNFNTEECELDTPGCLGDCTLAQVCGDGVVNFRTEQCEPSLDVNCLPTCRFPICGDGVNEANETCDVGMGDYRLTGPCPQCRAAACGEGFLLIGSEDCEDDFVGCDSCLFAPTMQVRTGTVDATSVDTTLIVSDCFVQPSPTRALTYALRNTSSVAATVSVRTDCIGEDSVLGIYRGDFNPTNVAARCDTSNDDSARGSCSIVEVRLAPQETVTVVVMAYFLDGDGMPYVLRAFSTESFTLSP
jgi:cysteine-rich repeat protein